MSYTVIASREVDSGDSDARADRPVDSVIELTEVRAPGGQTATITTITHRLRSGSEDRPVIFVFNGGPGAASAFLEFGLFGPERIDLPDPLDPPTHPPFALVSGADSPLDVADVVLIDPPGTGLHRLEEAAERSFLGTTADAHTMLAVIAAWCSRHGRSNSPRYLAGESYGTTRIASMLSLSMGGPTHGGVLRGLGFSGVLLLGSSLDLGRRGHGDIAIVNAFSAMAATAWYHGAVSRDVALDEHIACAGRYARTHLLGLLYAGFASSHAEISTAAETMSGFLGVRPEAISAQRLRIDPMTFSRLVLADRGLRVGIYDSRFTAPLHGDPHDPVADDAAMGRYSAAFAWAGSSRMRSSGLDAHGDYRLVDFSQVNGRWDWGAGPGVPLFGDAIADLARALSRSSSLRVFFGTGCFDLATPLGAAEYAASHLTDDATRVSTHVYESGHMPYLGDAPRRRLARDIRAFVTGADDV